MREPTRPGSLRFPDVSVEDVPIVRRNRTEDPSSPNRMEGKGTMTGPEEEAFRKIAAQDTRKFVITQAFAHGFVTTVIPLMTEDGEHEQECRIDGPWFEVGFWEGQLFIKTATLPASTVANIKVVSE